MIQDDWTLIKRQEQHFAVKLENIIPLLTKLITNPEYKLVKEKFPFPNKDEDTGLFKYDSNNMFYQNLNFPKIYCKDFP